MTIINPVRIQSIKTYGVDHSKFTTREEVECQDNRIKREEELMQQQRNMGITGNYMQYGTNFWNNTIRTKATLHRRITFFNQINQ
ncbi:MAG: hypothetical protein IKZ02_03115 [Alphaproteobacteria bacterium]|nr:hypothetical protein [Alphaproteobacteria bacterium]